jgi:hypothetical protein
MSYDLLQSRRTYWLLEGRSRHCFFCGRRMYGLL